MGVWAPTPSIDPRPPLLALPLLPVDLPSALALLPLSPACFLSPSSLSFPGLPLPQPHSKHDLEEPGSSVQAPGKAGGS